MALEICDRAYVFKVGKIAIQQSRDFAIERTKNELVNNERVKQAYLGIDPVAI